MMMNDKLKSNADGDQPMLNAESKSDGANDAAEPACGSPEIDIEELEKKIRSQLKELIAVARQCRDTALHLLERAEPFQVVRESLSSIVQDNHPHIQALHDEHGRVVSERVARIQHMSSDLKRDVDLRREAVKAQQQALNNLRETDCAAAERWSRAINERRTDLQGRLGDYREWLTLAEQRWMAQEVKEIDDV